MTPSAIRATVREYIRAQNLIQPGPLVLAISGGADSTALLFLIAELADELGAVPHVAHFDHRSRPRQSAHEAEFVATLANRVGAPIRVGRAERPPKNEEEARTARYAFLRRAAAEIGATAIATGHTRDDQAETLLLHLARGTGVRGLAGMRPLRDGIARPLLCIGRTETLAVCRAVHVRPLSDPSNRSLRFARNRIRAKVLPELAKLNPRVSEAIARLADAAARIGSDEEARVADELSRATGEHDAIDLTTLPSDERAAVLAAAWERAGGAPLTARHRAALDRLARERDGSRAIDLPGGRAIREYTAVRFERGAIEPRVDGPVPLRAGRLHQWNGWRIAVGDGLGDDAVEARLPESLVRTLTVRARAPGDRMTGGSRRKLQDVFTDAKVPRDARARWPVLAGAEGVWWVPFLTRPPQSRRGTRIAVAGPTQKRNVFWARPVREVASKTEVVAGRPRRGPRN